MVRTVLTVAGVAILVGVMWAARAALMLIYVSAIVAMGFSPMVRVAERPRRATGEKRVRVRRTLAILAIYLAIIAALVLVGLAVVPPLVDQAGQLWDRLPKLFADFQSYLLRNRLMTTRRVTLEEAMRTRRPAAAATRSARCWARSGRRRRRRVRPRHDSDPELLPAGGRALAVRLGHAAGAGRTARTSSRSRARASPR